jgi:hypothetical protein
VGGREWREGGREKEEKESREIQGEEESGQELMGLHLIIFLPLLALGRSGSTNMQGSCQQHDKHAASIRRSF